MSDKVQSNNIGLVNQIREDWVVHNKDWTRPGFRAIAVHRFGVWIKKVKGRPLRYTLFKIYMLLHRLVRNHYGIDIPLQVSIGRRLYLPHQHGIVMNKQVTIGDDCIIYHGVTLGAISHEKRELAPVLGNKIEVGCRAAVLGGITIGEGSRIGANAIIRTDVPPGAIAEGNPCKIITENEV